METAEQSETALLPRWAQEVICLKFMLFLRR